jgi:membrane protein implicated in regulation of membrane protease activity
VQPSSLLFLLIVAIWAAYLLQHWVRRRDHLATARSVDRFSEAMRVLERREPLPESPLEAPERRSYAVSPARPSRPTVVVKRAASRPAATTQERSRVRVANPAIRTLSAITGPRVRGLSLLASLALLVTVAVLVPLALLPWWSAPVAVVVLVADLAWLRRAARTNRAPRIAGNAHNARNARGATRPAARPAPTEDREGGVRASYEGQFATGEVVGAEMLGAEWGYDEVVGAQALASASVYDEAVFDGAGVVGPAFPQGDLAASVPVPGPGEWAPVPVPPPTYTLKARADRPDVVPAGVTTPSQPTAPADVPVADLPFDGLALDEELEELPSVYQAV